MTFHLGGHLFFVWGLEGLESLEGLEKWGGDKKLQKLPIRKAIFIKKTQKNIQKITKSTKKMEKCLHI